jgi:hypothetical protein
VAVKVAAQRREEPAPVIRSCLRCGRHSVSSRRKAPQFDLVSPLDSNRIVLATFQKQRSSSTSALRRQETIENGNERGDHSSNCNSSAEIPESPPVDRNATKFAKISANHQPGPQNVGMHRPPNSRRYVAHPGCLRLVRHPHSQETRRSRPSGAESRPAGTAPGAQCRSSKRTGMADGMFAIEVGGRKVVQGGAHPSGVRRVVRCPDCSRRSEAIGAVLVDVFGGRVLQAERCGVVDFGGERSWGVGRHRVMSPDRSPILGAQPNARTIIGVTTNAKKKVLWLEVIKQKCSCPQ